MDVDGSRITAGAQSSSPAGWAVLEPISCYNGLCITSAQGSGIRGQSGASFFSGHPSSLGGVMVHLPAFSTKRLQRCVSIQGIEATPNKESAVSSLADLLIRHVASPMEAGASSGLRLGNLPARRQRPAKDASWKKLAQHCMYCRSDQIRSDKAPFQTVLYCDTALSTAPSRVR